VQVLAFLFVPSSATLDRYAEREEEEKLSKQFLTHGSKLVSA
jgi:hypothetical protein